mgnify:CR=1 FL=1
MNHFTDEAASRVREALFHPLGGELGKALRDKTVEEIRANPDGKIWIVSKERGTYDTGETITPQKAESVLRLMADASKSLVTDETPTVSGELPGNGERFQGVFPPVSRAAFFVIRKPAETVYTLDDYVTMGAATPQQIATIRRIIAPPSPKNILVIGGTFTGKTTFGNALLSEPAYINDRCAVLEDTRELNFSGLDVVDMRTYEPFVGMDALVKVSLRLSPRRLILGEVRDKAAWSLLQAWNTGHMGGFATLHANDCASALTRIEDLVGEVAVRVPHASIISAIGAIIQIKFNEHGQRVIGSVAEVTGYNHDKREYELNELLAA